MKKLSIILLLLATGCMHQLTAPLSDVPVTSMVSYFWTGSAINFKDTNGNTTDQISFRDSGNFLLADDDDASNKLRTTIACTVSPDTVLAENFVPGCVLDIDAGWYFSQLDTVLPVPQIIHAAVISGGSTAYVATDSGVWSATMTGSVTGRFAYDGMGTVSDIDALTTSEGDSIFAATRSGQIWLRDPNITSSNKWTTFPAISQNMNNSAITALACDIGSLYAVVEGLPGVYQYTKHGGTWQLFTPLMPGKTISALRAGVVLSSTQYLILGSTDGTVGGYPTSGTALRFEHSLPGATSTDTIFDFAQDISEYLGAATSNGIFQSDQSLNFTSTAAIKTTSSATSLTFDDASGTLFFTSNGAVFGAPSSNGTIGSTAAPVTKFYDGTPLKLLNESGSSYLLTNTSFYRLTSSWNPVPGFPRTYFPNLQGGLLLLKSNPEVDSSWRAGTLVTNSNTSYPITARLLSRLDTLVIGGKSYADVLVVRYAYEKQVELPDTQSVPYWVVYYQRGRGPIMFDRVNIGGGMPERREVSN